MMARRVVALLLAAGLGLPAGYGLLALSGRWAVLPEVSARIEVTPFPLPAGLRIDPELVAGYLSEEMRARVETDTALRIALGTEGRERLRDIAIPRLLNTGLVRGMIREVRPLADLLDLGNFRAVAAVRVENLGDAPVAAAITLPGALRAEDASGARIEVAATAAGVPALRLDVLAPGEERRLTVWLDRGLDSPAPADAAGEAAVPLREGAALAVEGGGRGRLLLTGAADWPGADLEALPWARRAIMGLLIAALAGAAAVAGLALRPAAR